MQKTMTQAIEKLRGSLKRVVEKAEQLHESSEQALIASKDLSIALDEFIAAYKKAEGGFDK